MPVKKKVTKPQTDDNKYTCVDCKKDKPEVNFYKSKSSWTWRHSGGIVLHCKSCVQEYFDLMLVEHKSVKLALIASLVCLDMPFYPALFESVKQSDKKFSLGVYLRQINNTQYLDKAFIDSVAKGALEQSEKEVQEDLKTRWKKEDRQNRDCVLSSVGYDPFEDLGLLNEDLKFCYNSMAGYLDDESIRKDNHKLTSVIQIVNSQLQCRKIDKLIGEELLTTKPDEQVLYKWSQSKTSLNNNILKIAQDNNISSNYSLTSSKGSNTVAGKIISLSNDDFAPIRVNLFDIKTSEAMKQIADLSNRSILDQLNLDVNDHIEMIKEQRDMIQKFESINMSLEEENRLLKIKLQDIEKEKNKKR